MTLAEPLRFGLSHASLRMRFVGESGTAVTGEDGREEVEPFSDMERGDEGGGEYPAQGDMQ